MQKKMVRGQQMSNARAKDMPGLIRLLHELGESALFVPYSRAR